MEPLSESKFNMWRSCVAVVHLDNRVSDEERRWVEEKLKILPLTDAQKQLLISDLKTKTNFEESFKKITDKRDLAFLLDTLRVIGHLDKNFSAAEKASFKNLEGIVLKGLNLAAISAEIEKMEHESYHESEVYKTYNPASMFEGTFNAFMKFLTPGDYKFPNSKK